MPRTVLITGASTGLGAAAARALAEDSFVFIHYNKSEDAAKAVLADVQRLGGTGEVVKADVGSKSDCDRLVDQVAKKSRSLDVLVNNAGGLIERQSVDDGLTWELMHTVFDINTFSAMYITSRLAPLLRKGSNASVINITSVAMRHGNPSATIYGACKAALDSFTRGAAKELAPEVRVNSIAPGVIETPFHERYSTPQRMRGFAEATPLKHNGKAEDIAAAICFLVENDFITGESIDVNGGIFMR